MRQLFSNIEQHNAGLYFLKKAYMWCGSHYFYPNLVVTKLKGRDQSSRLLKWLNFVEQTNKRKKFTKRGPVHLVRVSPLP